jgi:hypothetical protein
MNSIFLTATEKQWRAWIDAKVERMMAAGYPNKSKARVQARKRWVQRRKRAERYGQGT